MPPEYIKRHEREQKEELGRLYKTKVNNIDDFELANIMNDLYSTLLKIKSDAQLRYHMFQEIDKQIEKLELIIKTV